MQTGLSRGPRSWFTPNRQITHQHRIGNDGIGNDMSAYRQRSQISLGENRPTRCQPDHRRAPGRASPRMPRTRPTPQFTRPQKRQCSNVQFQPLTARTDIPLQAPSPQNNPQITQPNQLPADLFLPINSLLFAMLSTLAGEPAR